MKNKKCNHYLIRPGKKFQDNNEVYLRDGIDANHAHVLKIGFTRNQISRASFFAAGANRAKPYSVIKCQDQIDESLVHLYFRNYYLHHELFKYDHDLLGKFSRLTIEKVVNSLWKNRRFLFQAGIKKGSRLYRVLGRLIERRFSNVKEIREKLSKKSALDVWINVQITRKKKVVGKN